MVSCKRCGSTEYGVGVYSKVVVVSCKNCGLKLIEVEEKKCLINNIKDSRNKKE